MVVTSRNPNASESAVASLSYVCQKCKQPLRLDDSIADLGRSTYDMISSTLSTSSAPLASPSTLPSAPSTPAPHRTTLSRPSAVLARLPPSIRAAYAGGSATLGGVSNSTAAGSNSSSRYPPSSQGASKHPPGPSGRHLAQPTRQASAPSPSLRPGAAVPSSLAPPASDPNLPSSSGGGSNNVAPGPAESFVLLSESQVALPQSVPQSPSSLSNVQHPGTQAPNGASSDISNKTGPNQTVNGNTEPSTVTSRLHTSSALFSLLSSNSPIDHPLCTDCADLLLSQMVRTLEDVRKERERYQGFEKDVKARRERMNNAPGKGKGKSGQGIQRWEEEERNEKQALKAEIERLKTLEESAQSELDDVEHQKELMAEELEQLALEEQELEANEKDFWKAHNEYLVALDSYNQRSKSILTRYEHDARELEKLQKTNVYNDAFCIGHEGGLATINGLRLGRLPTVPVDWPEINAAWGQTLLLLCTVARKLDYTFESYRPIPMASFSKIERLSDKSMLELYGSGEFAFGRLLQNRRFDHAMVAFLECLRQLQDWAVEKDKLIKASQPQTGKSGPSSLKIHHYVHKDKIGDVSIKLQFGSDETWTRALRHVLLNMKVLLAFASEFNL